MAMLRHLRRGLPFTMRTALLALALAACSTPVPVTMTDGAPIGEDAGDADYQCRTRCTPSAELCATNGCESWLAADAAFCESCDLRCADSTEALTCNAAGAWDCVSRNGDPGGSVGCTATR